ncbi:MAG: hypothetical protein GF364_20115 [Candidatus Lokiarchaeota archaeon]|nr:hypothetical protein [Candidatus Lokiarchaeota archaeon]
MTKLKRISLEYSPVGKMENLHDLPSLEELELSSTQIREIEGYSQLPSLKKLLVRDAAISGECILKDP